MQSWATRRLALEERGGVDGLIVALARWWSYSCDENLWMREPGVASFVVFVMNQVGEDRAVLSV